MQCRAVILAVPLSCDYSAPPPAALRKCSQRLPVGVGDVPGVEGEAFVGLPGSQCPSGSPVPRENLGSISTVTSELHDFPARAAEQGLRLVWGTCGLLCVAVCILVTPEGDEGPQ